MEKGCVGSANIGLPGKAVRGQNWMKRFQKLLDIFVAMLTFTMDIIGLLLCEVGGVDDMYDDDDKAKFDDLLKQAFATAAQKTGALQSTQLGCSSSGS